MRIRRFFGKRMLVNGVVKENLGGKTEVRVDCETEEERMQALDKWFGMRFTEEEKAGIKGWGTELTGDGSEGVLARQRQGGEVWEVKRGKEWQYTWRGPTQA